MHAQKTGDENLKTDKKGVIHGQWIILQSVCNAKDLFQGAEEANLSSAH